MPWRRIFSAVVLLAIITAICLPGLADSPISWTLTDGTLTILGSGPMPDYESGKAPWYSRRGEINAIVIASGITTVGSNSFVHCDAVASVSLPDGLLRIGSNAFWGCTALTGLQLPDSLECMESCAFFGCGLTQISIGSGITVLEQGVFGQCSQLRRVELPESLTCIRKDAFSRCYSLAELTIPDSVQVLQEHAFFGCAALSELFLPAQLAELGSAVFYGSGLKQLNFAGNAPRFASDSLLGLTAVARYPGQLRGWDDAVTESYGGSITWCACSHRYDSVFVQPTCTQMGGFRYRCELCGYSYLDESVAALGHSFTDYVSDGNATATADGTKTALCDRGCGATDTIAEEGSRLTGLLRSDRYVVDVDTVHAIPSGTTAAEFLSHLSADGQLQLQKSGQSVPADDTVCTGMTLLLRSGDLSLGCWTLLVTGDVNGDGVISVTDLVAVKAHLLNRTLLTGPAALAADTNGDGVVSVTDFIQIKSHILGKIAVTPH